jgi:hypothetical protein
MAGSEEAAALADSGEEKTTRGLDGVFLEVGVEEIDGVEGTDGAALERDGSIEETPGVDIGAATREDEKRDTVSCGWMAWNWR